MFLHLNSLPASDLITLIRYLLLVLALKPLYLLRLEFVTMLLLIIAIILDADRF